MPGERTRVVDHVQRDERSRDQVQYYLDRSDRRAENRSEEIDPFQVFRDHHQQQVLYILNVEVVNPVDHHLMYVERRDELGNPCAYHCNDSIR